MPDLDGVQTLGLLRDTIPGFCTPVIALAANAMQGAKTVLLAAGFAAYLTKPVSASRLARAVFDVLPPHLIRTKAAQAATPLPSAQVQYIAPILAKGGISLEQALCHTSGDIVLFSPLAAAFVRNYPVSRKKPEEAFAAQEKGDDETLRTLAHALKSAAGFVGAAHLSLHAELLEAACRAHERVV